MNFRRKGIAMMLVIMLLGAWFVPANADTGANYYGSYPASDIYVTQTQKHTCTLIATTMMLRNYSYQQGSPYEHVTESAVRRYCWSKAYGLSRDFNIGGVSVLCSTEIQDAYDKKAYLIMTLKQHTEGVVIYDTGAPHAIYLFGYDEATDTFFCADTINKNGGRAIPLDQSIIKGDSQREKINTIDKIWYVV